MRHVIIGGGPAATNAIETIRQLESERSEIILISDEPAYSRMALPYWLNGTIPREQTYTGDASYFEQLGVVTRFGQRAVSLDGGARRVTLDDGDTIDFDRLLIATGSSPVPPPIPGADLPGVQPLWTLDHVERVLRTCGDLSRPRVVLIGAGFVGLIVVGAMFKKGWQLQVVEQEEQLLPRMLDGAAAATAAAWLEQHGVGVATGRRVEEIRAHGEARQVVLDDGTVWEADVVIVATGVRPNTEWLDGCGIDVDHGILVDRQMQTSIEGIYAAGDVAQGPVLGSDHREVHAIQPTAVDQGRVAGASMAGASVSYPGSLLMNVVDVCGLQCVSYGDARRSTDDEVVIDNRSDFVYRRLVFDGDHLVGAIFAGRAGEVGMLNDIGMVRGMLQVRPDLGSWKRYLKENPFDIRRPYVGLGVAAKLAATTLLGRPTRARGYRFEQREPDRSQTAAHAAFMARVVEGA